MQKGVFSVEKSVDELAFQQYHTDIKLIHWGIAMSVQVISKVEVLREATKVLLQHLPPSKVARFWASWQRGEGNYLAWRDETFDHESVDSLYEKNATFQQKINEHTR